jgi:heat shock protein HslJ
MRRTGLVVVVAMLAVAAVGTSASAARTRTPLRGTNWVLTDRVPIDAPLGDVAVNAKFDTGRISGTSGCNGYSRSYTTNGARMTIANDGLSTQIACGPPNDAVERTYLERLNRVGRYRVAGDTLILSTRAGKPLLVFRASVGKRALAGGWNVTNLYTGNAVQSPVPGSALTLEFSGNRASGNSGCNTFDGSYAVSGVDGITLGPFRSTLKACADPAVAAQEQQYLTALGLATTYLVTGDELILYRKGGTIAATFERATGLTSGT